MMKKSTMLRLRWYLGGPFLVLLLFMYLMMMYDQIMPADTEVFIVQNIQNLTVPEGFLVHTPTCRIPKMDAFDSNILKYLSPAERVQCSDFPPLIESNLTSIWLNMDVLHKMNYTEEDVSCCYTHYHRKLAKKKDRSPHDDDYEYSEKCVNFTSDATINYEFIKVTCKTQTEEIYKDYHAFILPKKTKRKMENSKDKVSVLVVGVDAVSRLNFHRQFPKTLQKLKSLEAIELLGYNKVADNTFPNLVPVLTGLHIAELRNICWPMDNSVFDDCPFIWKNYSQEGYLTAYGEDACWMGTFNYVKKGFSSQPTDYYARAYIRESERDIGHMNYGNAKACVGPRRAVDILFDYAYKLVSTMQKTDSKYFAFFWGGSLTHDYLNVPPDVDEGYEELLEDLNVNNVMNNTVVIVMSDHGIRWGGIRETYQGRVEERLPFLYFIFPRWFKEKYSSALAYLRSNVNKLTSPFDLHETLVDFMDLDSIEQSALMDRTKSIKGKRGISLFLPIHTKRTCADAGITDEWCTCHKVSLVSVEESIVKRAARSLVAHLNDILINYIQCGQLSLNKILSARVESPEGNLMGTKNESLIQDYILVATTTPGDGKFEATIRHRLADDSVKVEGYVSRINAYGDQSKCVNDFHLRLYCYCT